jgi:hypothetical protein
MEAVEDAGYDAPWEGFPEEPTSLDAVAGFRYIEGDDGVTYRITNMEWKKAFSGMRDGVRVEFDPQPKNRGKYHWANNIKVIEEVKEDY